MTPTARTFSEAGELERLAAIAVRQRWISDPAFDREDLVQIAILAILEKRGSHPGRQILHARSVLRNLRESNQCKRRREQETLDRSHETPSREPDHVEEIMRTEIRQRLAAGVGLTCKQRLLVADTFEGLTPVEIAAKRDWKPSSVRRWIKEIITQHRSR